MGRLQVEIRHGHDNGPAQWGAVIALIVLVLFAAAGHHEIAAMLHEVLTIAEIATFSVIGLAVLALAFTVARRCRAARRRVLEQARISAAWDRHFGIGAPRRYPAIDAPRRPAWPTRDEWDEIHRRADYRRNS
jgi:hypothetical protein